MKGNARIEVRRRKGALLPGVLFVAFSLALPPCALSGNAEDPFGKMRDTLAGYQDGTYILTLQNRIRGQMLPEETVAVKAAKGGSVYMKWIGARHNGRELMYRPGWNSDKLWVKEGGTLSFCAVSVSLTEPLVTEEYTRTVVFFELQNLAAEVFDWKIHGITSIGQDGRVVIKRIDGKGSMAVSLSPEGLFRTIETSDGSGTKMEVWTLSDIHINVGLSQKDFDPGNPEYGFPGYSEQGISIDPELLKANLDQSWAGIKDYTCTLIRQERIKGRMQQRNTTLLKFRKPCDLYMGWIKEPYKGRELLYRQGIDHKMLVREGGILGLSSVRLSLDSWLIRGDTNHRITDLDIGHSIKMLHDNLYRALRNRDARIRFLGTILVGDRRVYLVESRLENQKANGYYAARCLAGHDQDTGLPIKVANCDESGQLFEDLEWSGIKFNVGLTDQDFDPKNPDYHF